MEFDKLVRLRKSVRNYEDKKVDRKLIEKCIEAARLAPSACNSQPWSFVAVDDKHLINQIAGLCTLPAGKMNKFVKNVPVIIVQVIERTNLTSAIGAKLTNREYNLIDTGIAMENLCLQATELGLGTCILGYFKEKKIKKILNIPKNRRIGLLCALGYEKDGQKESSKSRKELNDIFSFNKYTK